MAAIVKLVQGSREWHEHRRSHCNASESAVVLNRSPFQTPYGLWQIKTGRAEFTATPPMLHGARLEPLAREAYERLTGYVMQPIVMVDGCYSASLDGVTLAGDLVLEIKCPVKGRASELWKEVESGRLPEHYRVQVAHQLMVSGAALAHVYVFDGSDGVLLEQRPERERWPEIRAAWTEFMRFLAADQPPPLTERDTVVRNDSEWRAAAKAFAEIKNAADEAAANLETAKQRLISLATHARVEGAGVSVTRFWRSGNIDYKQAAQLAGVDLDQYRGQGREEIRVTVQK